MFYPMLSRRILHNASMLSLLSMSGLLFPLITFPYLTRVFSIQSYAVLVFVSATMQYLSTLVNFGFLLSATKQVAQHAKDPSFISQLMSDTILARLLLAAGGVLILCICCLTLPILREHLLFTWLSFGAVCLSCFVTDYIFRGLEKMKEITVRVVTIQTVRTGLLFLLIKSDRDLLWIPILDLISLVLEILLLNLQLRKYQIKWVVPQLRNAWQYICESFHYFIGKIANTTYGALTTLMVGIMLPQAEIAIWGVAIQLNAAVQQLFYIPVIDAIYPEMTRSKRISLLQTALKWMMPCIVIGCILLYLLAPQLILLAAGNKYQAVIPVFRMLLPVLLLAFPVMLIGWPALGAIGKIKQTAQTTWIAGAVQVMSLCVLIVGGIFTLPFLALTRNLTEFTLLITRAKLLYKHRKEFNV